jgi:hypothetical protein
MPVSRDGEICDVEIFRRWQGPVIADGGDDNAPLPEPVRHILTHHGFVEHSRPPLYRWYELPHHLSEQEARAHATSARAELVKAGYRVAFDPQLAEPQQ